MFKILYILPEYNSQTPSHLFHIFEMLEELGKAVDIFLLVEKGASKPKIKNLKQIYIQRNTIFPVNLLERLFVISKARILGYKTVYIHYSYWGAILSAMIIRLSGGTVYYWHCEVYDQFHSKNLKKKIIDEWPMIATLKLVNYLVTGTPKVGEYYKKEFNLPSQKIKIIPNWVNLQRFKPKNRPSYGKTILFLHRLAPRKGADYLPEIIVNVLKLEPRANFLVAGDGPLLKNLKLAKQAKLVGPVPNSDVLIYFNSADMFIMPSRQEGFPRVLLEAMATGTPFVATDVGGTSDILSPLQKKHSLATIEEFPNTIHKILKNQQLKTKLIASGLKQVQKYDIKQVKKQFIKLFS